MPPDDRQRKDHAHRLRRDRGDCRAGHVHIEYRDQQQIPHDVDHARDAHKQQRQPRIAQSAEEAADQIVEHYEHAANAANADVLRCEIYRFGGRLHEDGYRLREGDQRHSEHNGNDEEKGNRAADELADALVFAFAQIAANEDHHARRQLAEYERDQVHDAAARGNAGNARVGAKVPHYQHIHRAIHGL